MQSAGKVKTIPIVNHENKDLCGKCGGHCCHTSPGFLVPRDITQSLDEGQMMVDIYALIESGMYAISYRETEDMGGWTTVRFLKPKTIHHGASIFSDISWGRCVFHSDKGCQLEGINRPLECRSLVPNQDNSKCRPSKDINLDKELMSWWDYQHVLDVVEDLYWDKIETQRKS